MPATAASEKLSAAVETDELLVQRARLGDQRAIAQIYRRHAKYIAGVAYRLLGDGSELDDVVQETFLAALSGLASLMEPARLRPWLVTIAVRKVQRRLVARTRRRWLGVQVRLAGAAVSDPQVSRGVLDLYRVLETLPVKLRVPWVLARVEGASLEEVAMFCETSLSTTKRRITRAEDFVQRKLDHE